MLNEVLEYLPQQLAQTIKIFIKENQNLENSIEEIRLRINQNICLKVGQELKVFKQKVTEKEIKESFENICEKSVYSYINQIAEGFITIKGGNRVGITGSCVMEKDKVININHISSLNFRIARQIKDVSTPLLKYIIDIENNTIFNTLIVSPPGAGKTTIIRDLTRKISNRNTRNRFFT